MRGRRGGTKQEAKDALRQAIGGTARGIKGGTFGRAQVAECQVERSTLQCRSNLLLTPLDCMRVDEEERSCHVGSNTM